MTKTEAVKKPGSGLIGAGLLVAGIAVFVALIAINSTGSTGAFVWAMLIIGLILAGIGFAQRILAALENR